MYFQPVHKDLASDYGNTALREFQQFSSLYGPSLAPAIKVVELPDDTVPSAWARRDRRHRQSRHHTEGQLPAAGQYDRARMAGDR